MVHFFKRKNLFLFVVLIALNFSLFAENDEEKSGTAENGNEKTMTITVEDAVEQALKTHIDIKRGTITLNQKKREKNHSWNSVLPSVSVSGTGSDSTTWKDSDTNTLSLQAGINASLTLDLGLADKIKKIKAAYDAEETTFDATVRSTESAVRQSFYNLLYLKEKWNSAKSTCESYKRTYEQTQAKYNRGVASQIDLLSSQVNYESAKPDVDSAQNSYLNALISFADTVGFEIEDGTRLELSGTLDVADSVKEISHDDIEKNLANAPEIKTLEANLKTAEEEKKSTKFSTLFPSLTLSGNFTPELWSKETKSGTETETPNWSASLGISLPLDSWIPGSAGRDKIAALDDTVKDYEVQLENKKKTVRTSAVEKLKDIELSKKTVEARKLNLSLAEQSYQMTEEAYNRGTKDLLTLQNSLDTLEKAQLQLKSEQYNLISNVLDLENLLGLDLGTYFEE